MISFNITTQNIKTKIQKDKINNFTSKTKTPRINLLKHLYIFFVYLQVKINFRFNAKYS